MFRHGELVGIDAAARQARLADGTQLDYDYLILGTGVSAAFFGVPGAAEHSFSLYTRRDAVRLRNRLMGRAGPLRPDRCADAPPTTASTGIGPPGSARPDRSSAAARPVSSWLARSPSCAISRCRRHSPMSMPAGCTIVLIEQGQALLAPFDRHCALTPAASCSAAASTSGSARPSSVSAPTASCSPTTPSCPATSPSGRPAWPARRRQPASACRPGTAAGPGRARPPGDRAGPDLRRGRYLADRRPTRSRSWPSRPSSRAGMRPDRSGGCWPARARFRSAITTRG